MTNHLTDAIERLALSPVVPAEATGQAYHRPNRLFLSWSYIYAEDIVRAAIDDRGSVLIPTMHRPEIVKQHRRSHHRHYHAV